MQGAGVQGPLWEVQSLQAVRRGTGAVKGLEPAPHGLDLLNRSPVWASRSCVHSGEVQQHKGSRAASTLALLLPL